MRLSNDERERAVAALQSHATQGRLTDSELQTRSAAARSAVTRGDLAPLFADLPGGVQLDPGHPVPPAQAPGGGFAQTAYRPQPGAGDGREPSSRWGLLLVSVMPFVSVILFFLTGMAWGYQYSWLWFLLIPLAGAITYGVDGGRRR